MDLAQHHPRSAICLQNIKEFSKWSFLITCCQNMENKIKIFKIHLVWTRSQRNRRKELGSLRITVFEFDWYQFDTYCTDLVQKFKVAFQFLNFPPLQGGVNWRYRLYRTIKKIKFWNSSCKKSVIERKLMGFHTKDT